MNQAIFAPLPHMRPVPFVRPPPYQFLTYQYDEMCSVGHGHGLIRQLNPKWWSEFIYPLPVGTRIQIRHDVTERSQVTYQVISIENDSFRVVAYAYRLDEVGPECDMTSEQYREIFYPVPVLNQAPAESAEDSEYSEDFYTSSFATH
jgi:hypothetical protein